MIPTRRWLKTHTLDISLIMIVGIVGLITGIWAKAIILDDAMITFRVAENLAYGRGFVYNVGERVQVTTTPLYAIILAAGTRLIGTAPQAALWLNIALSAVIPMLTYDLGRRLAGRITGLAGALLITLVPLLIIAFSMESYLYVALILASLVAYVARRDTLAGVLVGVTTLTRGDAVLLGACLLTYDFLAQRRLRWRLILPAVVIPGLWYLFATAYYGSPFPATLSAKTAQGDFNWLGRRFLGGFQDYWHDWTKDYSRLFYLFPILIVLGLVRALQTDSRWLILIGQNVLYIAAFVGLGVTFAEWYYAPLMPGVALLTARGIQFVAHLPTRTPSAAPARWQPWLSTGLAAILTAILLATLYPVTRDLIAANPDWKAQVYPATARWLAENTSAAANLSTIDIGHLGYWSGRPIIDIVGLAQPDVPAHIAEGDFGYAIRHYQPDMVLIGALWLPEIQSTPWFQADYVPRHAFKFPAMAEPLVLFTRLDGVKVQDQNIPPAEIQPLQIDFNRQITLIGYHLNQPIVTGNPIHLTLFWQAEAPIEVDFTVFVQLVDANDQIVVQGDSKPQGGFYRTVYWQPGETIIDGYTLPLPADLPPGSYSIVFGFYEADSGARLQILNENGEFQSDYVRLPAIQVQSP